MSDAPQSNQAKVPLQDDSWYTISFSCDISFHAAKARGPRLRLRRRGVKDSDEHA